MLRRIPKRHAVAYSCRVFSPKNLTDFVAYLEEMEYTADPIVLSLARECYGDDCPRPFLTMYDRSQGGGESDS